MRNCSANQKAIDILEAVIALALFSFTFLGTEYLFDNMMGKVVSPSAVTTAQNYVLGISAIGFLLYHFAGKLKWEYRMVGLITSMVISVICIFVIQEHNSYASIMISGCIVFLILGSVGSTVCYFTTRLINDVKNLAKYVGVSYALGILIQFINNNAVKNDQIESVVISVFILVLGLMIYMISMRVDRNDLLYPNEKKEENTKKLQNTENSEESGYGEKLHDIESHDNVESLLDRGKHLGIENTGDLQNVDDINNGRGERVEKSYKNPIVAGISLICSVLFMTCIFSTLDNAVTLVHASGTFDIGQWPRMILAVSGLVAGILYDLKDRRLMNAMMYIVTLLSTICIAVIQLGGPFIMGLIAFYVSAGFFVVFFMTSFMDLSRVMKMPKLWAGMGRAVNNVCAFITTGISVALLESGDIMVIMIVSIILFACISVSIIVFQYQTLEKKKEIVVVEREKTVYRFRDVDEEEKFQTFSDAYSLTERERDVLKALLELDENVQEIADYLAISRAALYRHISNLNEKTQTKSRVGIMQCYYSWKM